MENLRDDSMIFPDFSFFLIFEFGTFTFIHFFEKRTLWQKIKLHDESSSLEVILVRVLKIRNTDVFPF